MRLVDSARLRIVSARPALWRLLTLWSISVFLSCTSPGAGAATMTRATLEPLFPPPLMVGEPSRVLPVWPIFQRNGSGLQHIGHAFETVDLEPAAGYSGKPINLLVYVDLQGQFLDVRLLSHREPIFLSAKGTAQLAAFSAQYNGLTVRHQVQVGSPQAAPQRTESHAVLHGVVAGTVSALAIDRSILLSASQVASEVTLARLQGSDAATVAGPEVGRDLGRDLRLARSGWTESVTAGLLQRLARSNREVEERFAGTAGAGRDALAKVQPDGDAIDLWFGLASAPKLGRRLLDGPTWERVQARPDRSELVLVIYDSGRLSPSSPGLRLRLTQGERRVELVEIDTRPGVRWAAPRSAGGASPQVRLWQTVGALPLAPGQPIAVEAAVVRGTGGDALRRVETVFTQRLGVIGADGQRLDAEAGVGSGVLSGAWPEAWSDLGSTLQPALVQRAWLLSVLAGGLILLSLALLRQRWLTAKPRRLQIFRTGYLVFTLVFIGWIAQGQLTVVTLTSLVEALVAGQGLAFLLADPVAVLLWAYVLLTLVVWGRGTFCGWLCPFGALQELLSLAAQRLHIQPRRLHTRLDAGLKRVKYGVLAVLIGGAGMSAAWTDTAVEIEPFKTAISLGFDRSWPYVVWALACAALSVLVFRGYCRYICPLGAALALFGRLRLFAWIPRREACGTPCQTCRHRCEYQAIAPTGRVDYSECFQCLDCVEIYQDDQRCLPLVRQRKPGAGRHIPIQPVAAAPTAVAGP